MTADSREKYLMEALERVLQQCRDQCVDAQFLSAWTTLQTFHDELEAKAHSLSEEDKPCREKLVCSPEYIELKKKYEKISRVRSMFADKSAWTVVTSPQREGDLEVLFKTEPTESSHTFLLTSVLEVPLFNIAAVIYETDLYSTWMPRVKKSTPLGTLGVFEKAVKIEFQVIWPLATRDMVVLGYGVDLIEENAILCTMHSVSRHDSIDIPETRDGEVRLFMNIGGFRCEFLEDDKTKMQLVMNIDPKVPAAPEMLLNFAIRQVICWIFHNLERAAKFDGSSVYAERIKCNSGFYEKVGRIIENGKKRKLDSKLSPKI